MKHQEDSPVYWRRWLREQGLTLAVERHVGGVYRGLRSALERMWTFAYAGAVAGAVAGVLIMVLYARLVAGVQLRWYHVLVAALGAALTASLGWWIVYWLAHRSQLRARAAALYGEALRSEDEYIGQVIETVSEGLAKLQVRPRDNKLDMDQLAQTTIFTGLRGASTSELERHLLEHLVGSAFVPTGDGAIFVFKLGPPCTRCGANTYTGPLRILNVPAHWATDNGYPRLKELPTRGRQLLVVPGRTQELADFLGPAGQVEGRQRFFGPQARLHVCERCGEEALRGGLLQERAGPRG